MTDSQETIFVVDDDQNLCGETGLYLEQYGFKAKSFPNTREARQALREGPCDVILLDIMLPGEDGVTFFRSLTKPRPKVIFVSALGDEANKVLGLELGADDYMVKPFSLRELLARIRVVLRQPDLPQDDLPCLRYHFAGWTMELKSRLLIDPQGITRNLSGAEFRLLKKFLENPERVLERAELTRVISQNQGAATDKVLDVQISRLRACLKDSAKEQRLIRTSRNDGYLFCAAVSKDYAHGRD